jgi:hypothetical protein
VKTLHRAHTHQSSDQKQLHRRSDKQLEIPLSIPSNKRHLSFLLHSKISSLFEGMEKRKRRMNLRSGYSKKGALTEPSNHTLYLLVLVSERKVVRIIIALKCSSAIHILWISNLPKTPQLEYFLGMQEPTASWPCSTLSLHRKPVSSLLVWGPGIVSADEAGSLVVRKTYNYT